MKQFALLIAAAAVLAVPAAADAAQCRDSGTGKFAKCGAPGAVPAGQYVAKGKPAARTPAKAPAAPAPEKPGLLSILKARAKPAATPAPAAPPPAAAKAKPVRCKTAAGKFVKCGTPGARPA